VRSGNRLLLPRKGKKKREERKKVSHGGKKKTECLFCKEKRSLSLGEAEKIGGERTKIKIVNSNVKRKKKGRLLIIKKQVISTATGRKRKRKKERGQGRVRLNDCQGATSRHFHGLGERSGWVSCFFLFGEGGGGTLGEKTSFARHPKKKKGKKKRNSSRRGKEEGRKRRRGSAILLYSVGGEMDIKKRRYADGGAKKLSWLIGKKKRGK